VSIAALTFAPAALFVLIELFRETKEDGKNQTKSVGETIFEGVCFVLLVLAWIPTVIIATTPGGAASLIGNAYFFTWILVIFVVEGSVWFIHDVRKEQHRMLREKEEEYLKRQRKVLEQTRSIQRRVEWAEDDEVLEGDEAIRERTRASTEYFDADQE
jgi:hypothetical protein